MNLLDTFQDLVTLLSVVKKTQKDSLLTQHLGDWFPGWSLNIHSHFLHFQGFISFQLAKGGKPKDNLDERSHLLQTQPVWYFDRCSLRKKKLGPLRTHWTKKSTFKFHFYLEKHGSFRFKTICRLSGSKQSADFMHLNLCIYSKFIFHFPTYLFSMSQHLVHSLCSISTAFC